MPIELLSEETPDPVPAPQPRSVKRSDFVLPERIHKVPAIFNATQKLWLAMRVLLRFTSVDLRLVTGANKSLTDRYLRLLAEYGYIAPVDKSGQFTVWRKVETGGPLYPRIVCGRLYDPNTRRWIDHPATASEVA